MILAPRDSDEHIEHFNPSTGEWERCLSTRFSQCPFPCVPHRLTEERECLCGKPLNAFLEIKEKIHKDVEEVIELKQ